MKLASFTIFHFTACIYPKKSPIFFNIPIDYDFLLAKIAIIKNS